MISKVVDIPFPLEWEKITIDMAQKKCKEENKRLVFVGNRPDHFEVDYE